MSETYGTIVIPNFSGLTAEDVKNIPNQSKGFVEELFRQGGFDIKALEQGCYGIDDAALKEGYIQLTSIDPEWARFASSAMGDDRHLEVYASFHDEYGTHQFFIKNADGGSFNYWFEEESDEFDQDDFDYRKYLERLQKAADEWTNLCPSVIKENFPDVLAYPPEDYDEE